MTPPSPPLRVDIRFTASRAHRMLPVTLTAIMRWMRSADMSSTRTEGPTMPALLTRAPSVPNSSAALNSARISLSLPTSLLTAMALPFLRSISATASRAAASFAAYPMQTRNPRAAAAVAVARPMPRLPPVIITTRSVTLAPMCRERWPQDRSSRILLQRGVERPEMAEGIANAAIARAPEGILWRQHDLGAGRLGLSNRRIDIRRFRHVDVDGHAGAAAAQGGQDVAAEFRKFVVQHHFAAKQLNIRVHDALAVVGEMMKRTFGVERLFVERDRFQSVLDANVGLNSRRICTKRHTCTPSQIQHQPRRIFQAFLDPHQESHGFLAVDHAVIVGQRQIHHRADLDLAADHHRTLLDLVHAQNAGLRRVEDRRRHQRAIDAAVGDGEGAALQLVDLELAVAGAAAV